MSQDQMLSFPELAAKIQNDIMKVVGSYMEQVPKAYRGQLAMFVASRLLANAVFMNATLAPQTPETRDAIPKLCTALEDWMRAELEKVDAPKILGALKALREKGSPAITDTEAMRFPGWVAAAVTTVWRMGFEELQSKLILPPGVIPGA